VRESEQLAEFVAGTAYADLPDDLPDRMKAFVLDSLAGGFVGSGLPWSQIVLDYERANGSTGPCSVFDSATAMSAPAAAFVNGSMVGAFETENSAHIAHAGGTVVPAALAAAEATGASGRDLILACIMGYEVVCRVGDAQTRTTEDVRGFHNPAANGPFSSAAAVGKVLGLDVGVQLNALGIAGSYCGGLTEFAWKGEMTKRLHIGLANRAGLEAAYLARAGFTGPGTVLEGPFGFLNAFSPTPEPAKLVAGLGTRWLTRDIKVKPFAAHGRVQATIAALQRFKAETSVSGADVTGVHIKAKAERLLEKRFTDPAPKTRLQAQLSVPYVIAVTMHRDLADPLQFDESTLTDPGIRNLAAAVTYEDFEVEGEHAHLEIAAGGKTYQVFAGDFRGSSTQPAQWDDIVDKFRRFSRHVLDPGRQDRIIETVGKLDALSDVGALMSQIRG
jgi:2-methylcitrate dehydratase PrpD